MTTWNLASALWNGAKISSENKRQQKLSNLVIGTRRGLEHDRACERCGMHVCASTCAPEIFGVERARELMQQGKIVVREQPENLNHGWLLKWEDRSFLYLEPGASTWKLSFFPYSLRPEIKVFKLYQEQK